MQHKIKTERIHTRKLDRLVAKAEARKTGIQAH